MKSDLSHTSAKFNVARLNIDELLPNSCAELVKKWFDSLKNFDL